MQTRNPSLLLRCVLVITFGCLPWVSAWAADTLVVGVAADYAPLAFKQNGKVVGIEPDNAAEVAGILGMQLRLVELPFGELIPALDTKKIDVVMSGMSVTEQRKQQVAFTEPFMQVGQMAIIRADDIGRFAYPRAIYGMGVRVGVEPGTTGAEFAQASMPGAQVSNYAAPQQAFAALRARDIDVYIHDAPTSWALANSGADKDLFSLYRLLTSEELAWAVRKDNSTLLRKLNQARDQLAQGGKLAAIQDFWIPVKVEVQ
jgi:polar amino acid transport system substrate-binding protein